MSVIAFLCAFVIILWIYFLWSRRKFYALALKMPGPLGIPFLGIAYKGLQPTKALYTFSDLCSQYKSKNLLIWIGPFPVFYTKEPQNIEIFLNHTNSINKSFFYDILVPIFGDGIMTIKSPMWDTHRRLMNTAFNYKILQGYIPLFNKLAKELCQKLEDNVNCGEVDVRELTFSMGFKSSVGTTLGLESDDKDCQIFLTNWEKVIEITARLVAKPWLIKVPIFSFTKTGNIFFKSREIILELVSKLVSNKINLFQETEAKQMERIEAGDTKYTFIDHGIKLYRENKFSFEDIIKQANVMTFSAFETTSITLYSVLMHLAMHPKYQEKAFEEIVTFFPDKEMVVNYEDLKNLVYLEMCINETLRHAPPIPIIGRDTTSDIPISKDIIIPKGTQLLIDVFHTHRDESVWGPNAKAYDPDHFLPANVESRHKYSFLAFSKGQRGCIGWQYAGILLKVALVQILRKYQFKTQFRFEDVCYVENLTLRYEKDPLLDIQKRLK